MLWALWKCEIVSRRIPGIGNIISTGESWLEYQKSKGAEEYQAYLADLTDMQERVLPYLQSFCSPEERMPDRINDAEKSLVVEGKGSIHERLKIHKEIIAKQQGKGYEGKGAEL